MRRIGIDVGGTNTDAVLLDGDKVVFAVKRPTTQDVTSGILDALKALRADPAARGPVDAVVIRIAATFIKFRRWTTAVMKCVVPITTASTGPARRDRRAAPSGRRGCQMSHPAWSDV